MIAFYQKGHNIFSLCLFSFYSVFSTYSKEIVLHGLITRFFTFGFCNVAAPFQKQEYMHNHLVRFFLHLSFLANVYSHLIQPLLDLQVDHIHY